MKESAIRTVVLIAGVLCLVAFLSVNVSQEGFTGRSWWSFGLELSPWLTLETWPSGFQLRMHIAWSWLGLVLAMVLFSFYSHLGRRTKPIPASGEGVDGGEERL